MVLLAGDLFHENKPSRKSMYQVMRSLRMNCYGEKPCELEMLSDASETFPGCEAARSQWKMRRVLIVFSGRSIISTTRTRTSTWPYPSLASMATMMTHQEFVNTFTLHGRQLMIAYGCQEGHLAALDLLQVSGLVNYYGRTPESDNIIVKPVLLQKGHTKLALYGMSNVRDERLYRTFRDGKVKFFQPNVQKDSWFNLMSLHQNQYVSFPVSRVYLTQKNTVMLILKPDTFQRTSFRDLWTSSFGATSTSV